MQDPTHFVIYYPDERQVALEPAERVQCMEPDLLQACDSQAVVHVSVPYGSKLYDGIVITACSKTTAGEIHEQCVQLITDKHKGPEKLLERFPRMVKLGKRFRLQPVKVSYMKLL